MYKRYNFDKSYSSLMVCGDLHGNFQLLKYKLRDSKITDTVVIIAGDCGFGFEKEQHYRNEYNRLKNVLTEQNIQVVFVRGNHDDKVMFTYETINYPNFITVPDYSVVTITTENDVQKNILCVGGAISIDRLWRKQEENKSGKKTYWTDEIPIYSPEILDEIKKDGIVIDMVVSHSCPSFAPLTDKTGIDNWIIYDPALVEDIEYERMTMTHIYDHLVKQDQHPIKLWCYGHFHQHRLSYSEEEVKFIMLDCFEPKYMGWDAYTVYFEN